MKPRSRKRVRPEQVFGQAVTPIYLVSAVRRITFFNLGCEKLTGWTADDVVGQLCEYATTPQGASLESLAASLCPPAEVFQGRVASVPTYVPQRTGGTEARLLHFFPLPNDDGKITAVLGIIADLAPPAKVAKTTPAQELHAELAAVRIALSRQFGTQSLVCRSEGMLRVARQLSIAHHTGAAVLISGEAGTGKEHVARAIHYESEWRTRSFVPLDCNRLSPLELEQTLRRLFDSERSDEFTASVPSFKPGTIFLSHVEQLPRDLQKTIVEAFSSQGPNSGRLRLIASTVIEAAELGRTDLLRPDFFHLLTTLCITVPPLRCRGDDLRLLAQHLLEESNRGEAQQLDGFGDDAWEKFTEYNWPGNVDELRAVIRDARGECDEPLIHAKHLPFRFRTGLDAQAIGPVLRPEVAPLEPFLAKAEKEQIEQALRQCRQNKSKAAQLLGMTRPRLYRRMEILGISDEPEVE